MGMFSVFTSKSAVSGSDQGSLSHSGHHISSYDAKHDVRRALHDKLGRMKGEEVFNMLSQDLDRDNGIGSGGASGREIDDLLHQLRDNHQDNLHDSDIRHVEEVLRKHFDE